MEQFEALLNSINIEELKSFISSLKKPCYESELLRLAFKNIDIINCDSLILYQNHFILFHTLFKLQEQYQKENKYLYVHFMRTFLLDYPEKDECRFFNEKTLTFCKSSCEKNKYYCDFHYKKIGENNLEELSLKYFYLDKNNYYKLNKETAEAFLNGTWQILSKYEDYKNSFKILDLPETANLDTIKKRYRYLAKRYHPDSGNTINKEFNEINNAYQFLIKLHFLQNIKQK